MVGIDPKTLKVGDILEDRNTEDVDYCRVTSIGHTPDKSRGSIFFDDGLWCDFGMDEQEDEWWDNVNLANPCDCCNGVAGHHRFLALLDQLRAMHLAKSADYGTSEDVYANYRRTAKLGIPPSKGILIRMADKWSRIETWANGGTLKNEGVVDSLLDLASYALGAVVMIEEEAKDGTK